jgi:serine/tyrosine/threonine adenylyltransferase
LPLLEQEEGSEQGAVASAEAALNTFGAKYDAAWMAGMRRKLALFTERDGDVVLTQDLLERMAANQVDFTLAFRRLCDAADGPEGDARVRALFADPAAYDVWAAGWRARLEEERVDPEERATAMRRVNPAFIPRNHLVEAALKAGVERQDFQPFEELLDVLSRPYEERPGLERYAAPARPEESVRWTFCGT